MHPIQINLECRGFKVPDVGGNVRRPQARDILRQEFRYRTNTPILRVPLMLSTEAHNTTESIELKLLRQ